MNLAEQHCKPASTLPRLSTGEAQELASQIPNWSVEGKTISRDLRFRDFRQAMDFVNQVAALANEEDHHPDIFISYNKVTLTITTHKAGGLTLNDFILGARIDRLVGRQTAEKAA